MCKYNCLIGITVFNLNNEDFNKAIIKGIIDGKCFIYNNIGYDISHSFLINIDDLSEIHLDEIDETEWNMVVENKDKYILFNIEWSDNNITDWIENGGIDFFSRDALLEIKQYSENPCSKDIDIKDRMFDLLWVPESTKYLVLCFEYRYYTSYEGEYECYLDYCGIVDMHNINLIETKFNEE